MPCWRSARSGCIRSTLNKRARYREAVHPSGGKSDPTDAELLARFFEYHQQQLRPWQPDSEETRRIGHLAEFRRKLVDERKSITLRLGCP